MKWEHRLVHLASFGEDFERTNERRLDSLGDKGWEVVSAFSQREDVTFVLMRRCVRPVADA